MRESLKTELPLAKCSFCFCLRYEWHHTFFSVSRDLNQDLTRESAVDICAIWCNFNEHTVHVCVPRVCHVVKSLSNINWMIFLMHKHCVMCGDKCILQYQSQDFTIKTNCNMLPKARPFPRCQHFVLKPRRAALRHTQNKPQCPPLHSAAHPNTPLPGTVLSSLTNALLCYQPIFTRRTSGHSQSDKVSVPHPHWTIMQCLSLHPLILLPIFSCPFSCYSSSSIKASTLFRRHRYECHFAMKLSGFARSSVW
jgi:hypothetical protein